MWITEILPIMSSIDYLDWNGSLDTIERAHKANLFVLIIGSKGTGKTSLVQKFAKEKNLELESINFSLRTRESHLVGTKTIESGNVTFQEGTLVKSMKSGGLLYLDELNAAEADMLLRLDEALDDRRQLVLKESSGETLKAKDGWFVIGTINPLSHAGTKEIPPQILSRFPVRIRLEYPPPNVEAEIVRRHVDQSGCSNESLEAGIRLANTLREAASVEEIAYAPSIRETISYAKLVAAGITEAEAATTVFGNVYAQWGDIEFNKVAGIITSMFGETSVDKTD